MTEKHELEIALEQIGNECCHVCDREILVSIAECEVLLSGKRMRYVCRCNTGLVLYFKDSEFFADGEESCVEEVNILTEELLDAMRQRGHSPVLVYRGDRFIGGLIANAKCDLCGMEADGLTKPRPNEIRISGEAVALCCAPIEVKTQCATPLTFVLGTDDEGDDLMVTVDFDHIHVVLEDGTDIEMGITLTIAEELQADLSWEKMVALVVKWLRPTEVDPSDIVKIRLAG